VTVEPNILRYGRAEPLPPRTALAAGPFSLWFEQGDLRYIRLGDREVLRRVYVAVRDRNWGTVPSRLSNVHADVQEGAFRLSFDVENREADIHFSWRGEIAGGADGTLRFVMDGLARSTFLRNRLGFCVLHPIQECAGARCRVTRADGTVEESRFPRYVAPHQPFLDIRAIAHEVAPGVWAEVLFEGDVFEMEDQRNWTDASFKTYCTPLRLPFPVEVLEGTSVRQSVTLRLRNRAPLVAPCRSDDPVVLTVGPRAKGALPAIGLGASSTNVPLTRAEADALRALRLSHLRADVRPGRPGWSESLLQAVADARALGAGVEIAVFLGQDPMGELDRLASVARRLALRPVAWLVFDEETKATREDLLRAARERLASVGHNVPFGGGSDAYFVHVNRDRPPTGALDFVSFSANPQVHAFDNASLMETLEALPDIVESARQFMGDTPVAVSPVTLRPRYNPHATGPPAPPAGRDELPPDVDARQMSLFAAAWTLAVVKRLAESGVRRATFFETVGWRGVMESAEGSAMPGKFPSLPGAVFPVYHVLADVGEFAGGGVVPVSSSDHLRVEGLALEAGLRRCVLVANLTPEPLTVAVQELAEQVSVRMLDERNAESAMRDPAGFRDSLGDVLRTRGGLLQVRLLPYAVARMDSTSGGDAA
jgi:hypothetical protein